MKKDTDNRIAQLEEENRALKAQMKQVLENTVRGIFDRTTDGVLLIDSSGTVKEWSKGYELMTGLDSREVVGRMHVLDLAARLFPSDTQPVSELKHIDGQLKELLVNMRQKTFTRHIKHAKTGEHKVVNVRYFPVVISGETMLGGISRDITLDEQSRITVEENERRLTIEKNRLQRLGDNLHNGCLYQFAYNTVTGQAYFNYISRAWESITDIPVEEAMSNIGILFDRMHPDDRIAYAQAFEKSLASKERFSVEIRFRVNSGAMHWGRLSSTPYCDGDTVVWDGFLIDITDSKTSELRLIAEKERLEAIGDNYPDGCLFRATMDMCTQELKLTYVSKPWENLTGIPGEAVVNDIRLALNRIHPDDQPIYMADTLKSAQTGENMNTDIRFVMDDGRVKWAQIASHPHTEGHMVVWDGFFLDITARKNTEFMLIAEKERLQTIGDNIPGGAICRFKADRATGSIELDYVSDTWQTVTGIPPKEAVASGMSVFEGVDPADMPMLMERINDCITNLNNLHVELRFHRPDGKMLWLQMSVKPTVHNSCIYADGVIFDITARKKAEQALLFEKERLEAIGNNLPDGVLFRFQLEAAKLSASGNWLQHLRLGYASARWEHISGIPLADTMADVRLPFMKIHPDDLAAIYPVMYESMRNLTAFSAEVRYRYADDDMRWFQISSLPRAEGDLIVTDGIILDTTARKEAEQALLFEKERLQSLGDNLPNGVLFRYQIELSMLSTPDWLPHLKLKYTSALWEQICNVSPADAMRDLRPVFMKIHPDDLAAIYPVMYEAMHNLTTFSAEVRYDYAPGNMRWIQISAHPRIEDSLMVIDGFMIDITARKKTEQALRTEKERLQAIGDNMPNGSLFRYRMDMNTGHMSMEYVSGTWEDITGISAEKTIADLRTVFACVEPTDRDILTARLREKATAADLSYFNFELRYNHPVSGKTLWYQLSSKPSHKDGFLYSDGMLLDITARKEAEQNLKIEKERLETLSDNLPEGTLYRCVFDSSTGKRYMEYVSRTWEQITGLTPESVADDIKPFDDIVHPDDWKFMSIANVKAAWSTDDYNVEVRITRNGEPRWLFISSHPWRDGSRIIWDGIMTDITARKEAESELALYREELEQIIRNRTAELETTNRQLAERNRQLSDEITARAAVMKELEESENKVHNFISQSFEGIMMLDNEGRIMEWNNALERITGIAYRQATGNYEWELLHHFLPDEERTPEQFDKLSRMKKDYILGGPEQEAMLEDQTIVMPDGTRRYLQTTTFPIGLSNTCYFGKIVRDITRQKLADMELERYRTQLEQMVDEKTGELVASQSNLELVNFRQALFIRVLRILQAEPDLPVAMNQALAIIGSYTGVDRLATWENHPDGINYGCTNEWCNEGIEPAIQYLGSMTIEAGKPWFDMLEKDTYICTSDITTLHPFIQGMLEQQGVQSIAVFPMSEMGAQFGFLSFNFCRKKEWDVKDVDLMNQLAQIMSTATKRWQAETALNSSRQTMQIVLDNINANIFVTDYHTRKLIFANKRFREEAGCEVVGYECWKMIKAGLNTPCEHCPKARLLDSNMQPGTVETWEDHNQLTNRWYTIQSMVMKWTNGHLAIMEMAMDVTDRKTAELELVRAKEKAEESDMLKTAFLANVSHEIRTPLNGIIGFLHFLDNDSLSPAERREYIDVVNSSSEQLVKLIDDIVDLARIEAGQMTVHPSMCNINDMMYELQTFFTGYMRTNGKEHIELVMDSSGFLDPCIACIDPVRLRQVLTNLLNNAIKFTQQGSIRFRYLLLTPGLLEFTVADTGIGLAAADCSIIFERFRQADRSVNSRQYGGTGLGLTISRSFVQMMGGDIRVESEKGHGSKFIFTVSYLPIKPECQYLFERKKDELLFDELPFEGLTALMAEPLSMKHKYYEKLLAPAGFAVKRVENIQQWFDYANKGNPVNAVILDTSVFDTATKDDFKKLREICKKQPLIIFGQEQNVNNFLRFCRNPNHAAFTEPVSCHDLVEALKKLAW